MRYFKIVLLLLTTTSAVDSFGQGQIRLFNGKNLDGWYTFLQNSGKNSDPLGVFTVDNGVIRVSGEEWGCITTDEEYENYRLIVEYKWGEKTYPPRVNNTRDGGVLVHSQGRDGGYSGIWMNSIECQMIEGGTGDIIVVTNGTDKFSVTCPVEPEMQDGSYVFKLSGTPVRAIKERVNWFGRDPDWQDRIGFRGVNDVEKPLGEWNTLEIIASGSSLSFFLNGVLVNKATHVSPAKGRIQVQSEGAEVFFRKIDMVPLPENYRFIYNSDADNAFLEVYDRMTPEVLYRYVDEVAQAGATTYFISPNAGMAMTFPTQVGDMYGEHISAELESAIRPDAQRATIERVILNLRDLRNSGHDPLGLMIDRAKTNGMETFVSFRPNEVHLVDQEDHVLFDRFWRENPQWRIGKYNDPLPQVYYDILGPRTSPIVAGWLPGGLNFAVPQVRAYRLAQLREICENYDIDGLEIDFQRFPIYFKPGEEAKHRDIMTKWMREVRRMVEKVAKKKGREIKLAARIMALPEQNTAIGLDPVAWANSGLLDFVTVSHYLHNNYQLPVAEYRKLLPEKFPLYASVEVEPSMDNYRKIAYPLWQQNVDGICLFNFFTSREGRVEPPFGSIKQIGFPMVGAPTKLLVANKHSNTLSFVDPDMLRVETTISTGLNPHEIVITPDHRYAYLSNYAPPGNTISVIDLMKRQHIKQISTGKYERIHGTAMAPDGRHAYFTAGQSGYVIEVDTRTNEVTRQIPTHGKISHMVYVSPDGTKLYTGNIESEDISVIDRASGELLMKIPAGPGVEGMAFTPDRKYLWAMNQTGGSVMIIDMATHSVTETFELPGMPVRIRFTPDGKRAIIAHWIQDGEVSIVDVASRQVIKKLKIGKYAIGVEISADGKFAFVGCEDANKAEHTGSGNEQMEHAAESDGVHVIDLEKLEVTGVIKTGLGPDPMMLWYPPIDR